MIQSLVAAPNISNGNQPVNFLLNLNSSAQVTLTLYSIAGEKVFNTQIQAGQGDTTILWNLKNSTGQSVASGLYIFYLKAEGADTTQTRIGKVLVIH